ncbi:hypothetical protein PGT21_030796 [Puccinia graminis f. sp. tritici]|uniref:Dephospho-CoA kinase n=2 Tax=Puccinia graminis f. sp. tritici TaxID=56615 RepID=E3JQN2_PUCGT|nr:dephospho-CoA kinase [Puccinia graminis f. sp. tritici CRL 75-36-700-3]EFP74504.1 dephospho-CoA kinase [Puccinia graminis f. sp. tritici CRL 75-36-700-3]KAA1106109.1 hypothetical protein PGT21_029085 [Puccinia graminis f. sp. tritici]KAA1109165.1 hypothetical protein PGTUg99_009107 [Puccinia graminis f. sp. tritici]KAA1115067.1 hypothetical protein PGT21_030796 [Puccinia graminis f. sp. tritici]
MLVVGLTGGIASGKSTVSGLLKSYCVPVIDLDHLAREVVEPGSSALTAIQNHFSSQPDIVYSHNGCLNRERLGEIIFNNPSERQWLNNLLHPRIRRLMVLRLIKLWLTGTQVCVIDSPLLIETGMWKFCGKVVIVYCSEELQLQRLQSRNGLSRAEAKSRIAAQMGLKSKLSYADHIVDNSGQLIDLERQVERLVWKFEKSVNKFIWLVGWLVPPVGLLNGLLTIFWRVWLKPFGKSHRKKARSPRPPSTAYPSH